MSDKLDKAIKRFTRMSCEILDTASHTIDAINAGLGIILDAETQARAEMRAAEFTNCKACQSGLVLFIKDNPHANHEVTQAVMETLWETCPTCKDEYNAVLNSEKCKHGIRNWENCETCLDEWASTNEPEDIVLDTPSEWEVQNNV